LVVIGSLNSIKTSRIQWRLENEIDFEYEEISILLPETYSSCSCSWFAHSHGHRLWWNCSAQVKQQKTQIEIKSRHKSVVFCTLPVQEYVKRVMKISSGRWLVFWNNFLQKQTKPYQYFMNGSFKLSKFRWSFK